MNNKTFVFISDIVSTMIGGLIVVASLYTGSQLLANKDIDPMTKNAVAIGLFGSSIAGGVIGKQQPTALRDLYTKSTTEDNV